MTATELQFALIARRKALKLTLRAVAQQAGVSHSTLHRVEQGYAFDYETGMRVINWLNPPERERDTVATFCAAVFVDARLSDKQKSWMVSAFREIYEILVERNS